MKSNWTQQAAIELCKQIEKICPKFGCHVALTGGLLYSEGARKDCDILFYRIRQVDKIDKEGLFLALEELDVIQLSGFGWCHKAEMPDGRRIDIFFPEDGGDASQYTDEEIAERKEIKQELAAMRMDAR